MRKKIGECLIQAGLITEEDLQIARGEHERTGERLGAVLVRLNLASEKQIARALAYQLGFPYTDLQEEPPQPAAIILIPKDVALARACVAVRLEKNLLTVAISEPLLPGLVENLESLTGHQIKLVVVTRTDVLHAIETAYPETALVPISEADCGPELTSTGVLTDVQIHEPCEVTRRSDEELDLVELIVTSAITSRASDVHIEPRERGVLVRYRLDGVLKEVLDLPRSVHDGIVASLKVMAGMDVTENRLPQDGRLRTTHEDGREVDFHVTTIRTLHGEKLVMRLLDQRKGAPRLEELGFSTEAMAEVRGLLKRRRGMILVVGPTGSGRTTTLSAAVNSIKSGETNIVTLEDSVEYQIQGVNQTQVDGDAGLTFPSALRAILRQDPDVVLVGEIRDRETANAAMEAAQHGQLVLAALHADDAPASITRFADMGMEPFITASTLIGVIAQQLVRRLCTACRQQYTPDADTLRALGVVEAVGSRPVFYQAEGCEECNNTGYRGRIAIYEVMRVSGKIRRLIAQGSDEDLLRDAVTSAGTETLGADGFAKVRAGITSLEELLRVVSDVRKTQMLCPERLDPLRTPREQDGMVPSNVTKFRHPGPFWPANGGTVHFSRP